MNRARRAAISSATLACRCRDDDDDDDDIVTPKAYLCFRFYP